jgi:hypothetical protein
VRLRSIQIINNEGQEETAVAAYWVTDGIDRCQVGFLPTQCVKDNVKFEGEIAQVLEFCSKSRKVVDRRRSDRKHGLCYATIISGIDKRIENDCKQKLAIESESVKGLEK